jgi:energy-coupling factor transport system ATP-binding protein
VLTAATNLVDEGRSVIISEHRLEHLLRRAGGLLLVDRGIVTTSDPAAWTPPTAPARPARSTAVGGEAWSLKRVSAGFGRRLVLDGVDLAGHSAEVVVLSGPNGGGKTTLLRVIAGSLAPIVGDVWRRRGRVAYLPQNPSVLLHQPTVRAEVTFTLERSGEVGLPGTILKELGLLPVADRYPRDLSCGERQRAALAAVLPGDPALVLLDEPTRGIDSSARGELVALVARLRDRGASVVLATHDEDLRNALADRVIDVRDGKVSEIAMAART